MPRKRKYTDSEQFGRLIDAYFAEVDQSNTENPSEACPPVIEDLWDYLGITRNTWESYKAPELTDEMDEREKTEKREISDAVKKAEQKFTAELVRFGLKHPNRMALIIYLTKQKHYGGYTDKQEVEHKDMKIDLTINGVKGDAFG